MRFIAFTDTHGNKKSLERLKKYSNSVDFVICCGDFTIFGSNIDSLLKFLNSFNCKVFLIPGNHEDHEELVEKTIIYDNIVYLEDMVYNDDELLLFASSGNGFIKEDDYFDAVSEKYHDLLMRTKTEKNYIVMTHAPPYNTALDRINKRPCGNKSVRSLISNTQPIIAVSGHLHENKNKKDKIINSIVLNPGDGALIEIKDKKVTKIEFIK